MANDDAFLQTLRATFKVEAAEHLQTIGAGLLALEKTQDAAARLPIVETVFRAAHSLKGAARAVSFTDIESICQSLESVFASWKRGESVPTANALDVAHRALDEMAAVMEGAPAKTPLQTAGRAPAGAPPQTDGRAPAGAPPQTDGRAPASAPRQTAGRAPADAPLQTDGRAPASAPPQTDGRAPAGAPAHPSGRTPEGAHVTDAPMSHPASAAHASAPPAPSASSQPHPPGASYPPPREPSRSTDVTHRPATPGGSQKPPAVPAHSASFSHSPAAPSHTEPAAPSSHSPQLTPASSHTEPAAPSSYSPQGTPAPSSSQWHAESQPSSSAIRSAAPAAGPARTTSSASTPDAETVRISVSSLDRRLLEAEELLAAKLAANARADEIGALLGQLEQWRKECIRIQPQARALRRASEQQNGDAAPVSAAIANGVTEFIDWNNDHLRSFEAKITALRRAADQDRHVVGKLVDDMLENSKKLLMLPLATLGLLLPKTVRDLSRDQGKEADLVIRGEDVKIDKRILEEIKDPLIHLLRNCIDHGIETPEARRKAGKPARATITLAVTQVNGNQVDISLQDDGAGIDIDKVKASAIKRGLLSADAAESLPVDAALRLVLEPDVSTSPMITQVSGRGLGLAIVREKAEKLGGRVTIESERGAGTIIRMLLPLTLATFRGVIIESAQRRFIVPTAQVERAIRFRPAEVQTVENRETLSLQGRTVALADLAQVLGIPPARRNGEENGARPALILGIGEQRVAFAVDAIVDEREVLVKRLTRPLSRVRNIAGATVLGSGEVAPILNVQDLLKSARHVSGSTRTAPPTTPATAAPAKRVLVAEDSITSRMLIKGILESAGYEVKTAVDGMDAYASLRTERFDALVSDVEMPRLNGFDLTARVRADRNLAELPVILVTALESREDRERGIDVGASAYLVKSDLDQSNLLEALRRLA